MLAIGQYHFGRSSKFKRCRRKKYPKNSSSVSCKFDTSQPLHPPLPIMSNIYLICHNYCISFSRSNSVEFCWKYQNFVTHILMAWYFKWHADITRISRTLCNKVQCCTTIFFLIRNWGTYIYLKWQNSMKIFKKFKHPGLCNKFFNVLGPRVVFIRRTSRLRLGVSANLVAKF